VAPLRYNDGPIERLNSALPKYSMQCASVASPRPGSRFDPSCYPSSLSLR
jgi:hypothetical protein